MLLEQLRSTGQSAGQSADGDDAVEGTHHMNSVFSAFSCRRLELIHSATPSTQAPRSRHSGAELTGRHQP